MDEEEYRFYPRPEAHPVIWHELLPPLQRAVRNLLLRLDGAVEQVDEGLASTKNGTRKGGEVTANCFLVYGERGSGKSTVLLSAKSAISEGNTTFFKKSAECAAETNPQAEKDEAQLRSDAQKYATSLEDKGTVWLDVLDLDPLPPKANMLTTVLTRIREALDSGLDKKAVELASIIEEGSESARNKLSRLINDATFIWEDIQESDTRNRANRQISAAGIYTHFRERFCDAVKALSTELARKRGNADHVPIILPIDNIDRSTEHLHSIIKMAEMVSSPYLWIVMAGDREDLDTFLTRGFWKDLVAGATGAGKIGLDDEDEALVIARRQAAAASHKLLPPDHRVEVKLMSPEQTLKFCPSGLKGAKSLRSLLDKINVNEDSPQNSMSFLDIFDTQKLLYGTNDETNTKCLTKSAHCALSLPARGVFDLWQSAYWEASGKADPFEAQSRHRAERVTRTMLRNRIAESKISNRLGLYLQEFIICSQPDDSTIIKAYAPNPSFKFKQWRNDNKIWCYSTNELPPKDGYPRELESVVILPQREETYALSLKEDKEHGRKLEHELPRVVTGWTMVLYDILAHVKQSWTVVERFPSPTVELIQVLHLPSPPGENQAAPIIWPMPDAHTFLATDVISSLWFDFSSVFYEDIPGDEKPFGEITLCRDYIPWTMVVGWIACIVDAVLAIGKHDIGIHKKIKEPYKEICECEEIPNISTCINTKLTKSKDIDYPNYLATVIVCENLVFASACTLFEELMEKCSNKGPVLCELISISYLVWFIRKMPLLLGRFYVPMKEELATKREENLKTILQQYPALKVWKEKPAFMASYRLELEKSYLAEILPVDENAPLKDLDRLFPKKAS